MELHITVQLKQVSAQPAVASYLDRLPLSVFQRERLLPPSGAVEIEADAALRAMHGSLAAEAAVATGVKAVGAGANAFRLSQHHQPEEGGSAAQSVLARLLLAYGEPKGSEADAASELPLTIAPSGAPCIPVAPPINRKSMVPRPWGELNPLVRWVDVANRRFDRRSAQRKAARQGITLPPVPTLAAERRRRREEDAEWVDGPDPVGRWRHSGNLRRLALLFLMLLQTGTATYFMQEVLPYHGGEPLELAMLMLFAVLFCWVSAGFWTALMGFMVLMRGPAADPYLISREDAAVTDIAPEARTAIVMPICNEDVTRVFAGLRATYESLARTNEGKDLAHFDFFILSDSSQADICAAEIDAWVKLCTQVGGFGRIFYRHRVRRVKRKSGNIDDFCRRWGASYRYMIVLDADSVMSGDCLAKLVRLMQRNPGAGIIQTAPRAAGRDTLYARIQQFATRVYGPLFTAGLHYWQLGESHFWGHNAIIRLAPFMRHCALAPLPGTGPMAGEIMSHDFVEASLMRRAGWSVWIAYDLDGSYEEMPPNLLDELGRDRRWCQGNLMNFRLFLARGMHPVHRAVFATGVMAYISAPLWCLFLILSTLLLANHTLVDPQYFVVPKQLFPIWPEWHPEKALALFTATATLLFLPKILSVFLLMVKGAGNFGGSLRLMISMFLELIFSMLLAPVRMLFHTRFVLGAFLGWAVGWKSPPRADSQTGWNEAVRRHGWHTLLGVAWGGGVYWLSPSYVWWLLPITGSLAISIPMSVLSSRVGLGRLMRKLGLFLIPEEKYPPRELQETVAHLAAAESERERGFVDAVVDPVYNALHCAVGRAHPHRPQGATHVRLMMLRAALRDGPLSLTEKQRTMVLDDSQLLSALHFDVWHSEYAHPAWRAALNRPISF
ncbi:MAG TPA: glucans biosynthesis glucosyltransferase MdoH [Herbaspirillum sp.]|nr:glucans biosynthesis glucosyltransferase MdoH [Herbaspirillum sp.]